MTDWTEESVREALACVDAEFGVWTQGSEMYPPVIVHAAVNVAPNTRLHVESQDGGVAAEWMSGFKKVSVAGASDIRPALHALRTLVIATHGKDAWPWEMRD